MSRGRRIVTATATMSAIPIAAPTASQMFNAVSCFRRHAACQYNQWTARGPSLIDSLTVLWLVSPPLRFRTSP